MARGVVGGVGAVPGSHVRWGPSLDHMVGTSVAADLNNRWWTDIFLNFISPANIPSTVRTSIASILSFIVSISI